jgi:hypothetical protein
VCARGAASLTDQVTLDGDPSGVGDVDVPSRIRMGSGHLPERNRKGTGKGSESKTGLPYTNAPVVHGTIEPASNAALIRINAYPAIRIKGDSVRFFEIL